MQPIWHPTQAAFTQDEIAKINLVHNPPIIYPLKKVSRLHTMYNQGACATQFASTPRLVGIALRNSEDFGKLEAIGEKAMANDEQTIRDLQQRWMEAWQKNDLTTLEIILAPEFLLTLSTDPTKPMNRADWLRLALSDYRCEAFNYEKMAVRIFDGWALVGSRYRQKASVKGVDRSGEFFLTDVWRRSGDNWQVIGRYSSFPEPLSQSTEALK